MELAPNSITLLSRTHGMFVISPQTMDHMIRTYLPASVNDLVQLIAAETGTDEYDDIDSVTEALIILAEAKGLGT